MNCCISVLVGFFGCLMGPRSYVVRVSKDKLVLNKE